jgi:hypothetical protein
MSQLSVDGRLLRIEARRNVLLALSPLLLLLVAASPVGRHLAPVALWPDRSIGPQNILQGIGPFVAGSAAWMASREHRRGMTDLLASTPRDAWVRSLLTWAATAGWAILFYAAATGALFGLTAVQATWGHPVWWPALSGMTALLACAAIGHAAGRLLPGRFTAPLAAIGVFLLMSIAMATALNGRSGTGANFGVLSPLYPSIGIGATVYYATRPDLGLVQITCYLGVAVAALGLTGLGVGLRRRIAIGVTVLGVALTATAVGLTATSHRDAQGVVVPLLHNAASDRSVPYTPACGQGAPPMCVHPAYSAALPVLGKLVDDLAAPLVGTPGLVVRVEQTATGSDTAEMLVQGSPPVLTIPHSVLDGHLGSHAITPSGYVLVLQTQIALDLVTPPGTAPDKAGSSKAGPAQRALAVYLLRQAGDTVNPKAIPDDAGVTAAAQRFAALTPTGRHAWLVEHVAALRAGDLTLAELP